MPIRFSGLELLTPEQQFLLKEYALYDTLFGRHAELCVKTSRKQTEREPGSSSSIQRHR